jgi:hypothetical protein
VDRRSALHVTRKRCGHPRARDGQSEVPFLSPRAYSPCARGSGRLNITEYLRIHATGEIKLIVGVYSDDLVKCEGRWQFAHRTFPLQIAFDEKPAAL